MLGRRNRKLRITALTFVLISFFLNVYFIATSYMQWHDSWLSPTKYEGMLRVMRYIELEREVEGQIRDEFVDEIWKCMKEDFITSARRSMGTDLAANAFELSYPPSSSKSKLSQDGKKSLRKKSVRYLEPMDYSYISDQAEACAKNNISVLIASPSSPYNFDRRMKMRLGPVGQFARDPKNRAKLLFFLGMPTDSVHQRASQVQDMLNEEQSKFHDIVQSTFIDTYKNITKKGLLLPKWLSTFCHGAEIALRIDDDIDVNVTDMVSAVKEMRRRLPHFILGVMREDLRPRRKKSSKYFLSFDEYPYRTFPDFLLGGSLGYPVDTARLVLEACRRVFPEVWLDDVWITGMCARRVAVPIFDSPAFYFVHDGRRFEGYTP